MADDAAARDAQWQAAYNSVVAEKEVLNTQLTEAKAHNDGWAKAYDELKATLAAAQAAPAAGGADPAALAAAQQEVADVKAQLAEAKTHNDGWAKAYDELKAQLTTATAELATANAAGAAATGASTQALTDQVTALTAQLAEAKSHNDGWGKAYDALKLSADAAFAAVRNARVALGNCLPEDGSAPPAI